MIRPKPDIPERIPVLSFPTPQGQEDLIFFEVRDGDLPKNKTWAYGDPHPDSAKYPHHELVFVTAEGGAGWQRWYYATTRENQHLYNWQVRDTNEWPQLEQTFVIRRSEFSASATYPMPPLGYFPYPLEWAAVGVEERPLSDEVLSSIFVTVVVVREKIRRRQVTGTTNITTTAGSTTVSFASPSLRVAGDYIESLDAVIPPGTAISSLVSTASAVVTIAPIATGTFPATIVRYVENELLGREFDADTNATNTYRRSKVDAGTTIPTGIQTDGSVVELQPVNTLWSIKTTKQAAGLAGKAVDGVATRSYKIITNYAWPAVLNYVRITPVYSDPSNIFSQITGYVTVPVFATDPYSGPCLATVIETWTSKMPVVGGDPFWTSNSPSNTSPKLEEPTPLLPKSISFNSPLLQVEVPACLHGYVTFYAANFQQEYPATNYPRWPGSVVAEVDLRPNQGGWLKRVIIVDAPTLAGGAFDSDITLVSTAATSFVLAWTHTQTPAQLRLDVSTDPSFKTGFLSGFKDLNVYGTTGITVTGVTRGVPYYCRLRAYRFVGLNQIAWESNTLMVMCPPVPEIALYTAGPDGSLDTEDDVALPTITGTLAFGNATPVVGATRSFLIRNPGLLTLSGISVSFTGDYASYFTVTSQLPTSIPPGGSATVDVLFAPTTPTGAGTATMTLLSDASNIPSYVVNLTGSAVKAEINVQYGGSNVVSNNSPAIALGNVNTGSSADYVFTVQNLGNGPLEASVQLPSPTPSGWSLVGAPASAIAAGSSGTVTLRFTPAAGGAQALQVTIANNDPDGSESPYLLNVTATGVAVGRIAVRDNDSVDILSGGPLYLGFAAPGHSTSTTITVRNVGVGNLTLSAANFVGGDASLFSVSGTLPATIAPGGSSNLSVIFFPPTGTTTGLKSTTLELLSSDPIQPTFSIAVSGTAGTQQEIQVEAPSLGNILIDGTSVVSFGNLATGLSRSTRFTINNLGNARLNLGTPSVLGGDVSKFTATALNPLVTHLDPGDPSTAFDVIVSPGTTTGPLTTTVNIPNNDADENPFNVTLSGFAYPPGSLQNASSASLVLGQSNLTADAAFTTDDSTIRNSTTSRAAVSSSGRIAIADTQAHRVLVWNSYVDLISGKAADVVLGQTSFTASAAPTTITVSNLQSPRAVAWYGNQLVVADTGRNRILIYSTVPASHTPGTTQAASLVLGQGTSFTTGSANSGYTLSKFGGITDIFVVPNPDPSGTGKAGSLLAADPVNHRILLWTSFPAVNGQAADHALGQAASSVATPTSPVLNISGLTYPRLKSPQSVCVSPSDGKLYIADTGWNRVVVFPEVPNGYPVFHSAILFQPDLSSFAAGSGRGGVNQPSGVSVNSSGQLAVADTNNYRALLFYSTSSLVTGSLPGAVLGQPNFDTTTLPPRSAATLSDASGVSWQGNDLLVTDRNRVCIFKP
jgi:hypothetical protein